LPQPDVNPVTVATRVCSQKPHESSWQQQQIFFTQKRVLQTMNDEKRNAIDTALDEAGLSQGRVVIGTYDAAHEGRVGVYFHYRLTDELANALIKLAMQDEAVHAGLEDLRRSFALILEAVGAAKPLEEDQSLH
jgi:hypothetical protein